MRFTKTRETSLGICTSFIHFTTSFCLALVYVYVKERENSTLLSWYYIIELTCIVNYINKVIR